MQGIPGKETIFFSALQGNSGDGIVQAQNLQMACRDQQVEIIIEFANRRKAFLPVCQHGSLYRSGILRDARFPRRLNHQSIRKLVIMLNPGETQIALGTFSKLRSSALRSGIAVRSI